MVKEILEKIASIGNVEGSVESHFDNVIDEVSKTKPDGFTLTHFEAAREKLDSYALGQGILSIDPGFIYPSQELMRSNPAEYFRQATINVLSGYKGVKAAAELSDKHYAAALGARLLD